MLIFLIILNYASQYWLSYYERALLCEPHLGDMKSHRRGRIELCSLDKRTARHPSVYFDVYQDTLKTFGGNSASLLGTYTWQGPRELEMKEKEETEFTLNYFWKPACIPGSGGRCQTHSVTTSPNEGLSALDLVITILFIFAVEDMETQRGEVFHPKSTQFLSNEADMYWTKLLFSALCWLPLPSSFAFLYPFRHSAQVRPLKEWFNHCTFVEHLLVNHTWMHTESPGEPLQCTDAWTFGSFKGPG